MQGQLFSQIRKRKSVAGVLMKLTGSDTLDRKCQWCVVQVRYERMGR